MIQFEKEVIEYLGLPSIPVREHDGSSAFDKGIAVVELRGEHLAYAVCAFDPNVDSKPRITKVFGIEPFIGIKKIFVVPSYMTNAEDVQGMDLDDESKKKAEQLLEQAKELENEGVKDDTPTLDDLPEWVFNEIHSKEEAVAWLRNFQSRERRKGRIPTTDENIKLRLFSIYCELQKRQK